MAAALAGALLLLPLGGADARQPFRLPPPRAPTVKRVIITPDNRCPRPVGDEILVCGIRNMKRSDLKLLHQFSRCVARERPEEARAVLAGGYSGEASAAPLKGIVARGMRCAQPGRLSMSGLLFAGAMAEALVRPVVARGGLESRMASDPGRAPLQARDEAEVMSLCTVRAAPSDVDAVFATEAASDEEKAALRILFPRLSACLGNGVRLVTNRSALRASLAIAAWRLLDTGNGREDEARS
jgi:hypothetical protein